MNFNMFNKMKTVELKNYLCLRGLQVIRKKVVLVARAFSTFENNFALIKAADEVEVDLKQKYDDKLKLNELNIPDPFKLNNG